MSNPIEEETCPLCAGTGVMFLGVDSYCDERGEEHFDERTISCSCTQEEEKQK